MKKLHVGRWQVKSSARVTWQLGLGLQVVLFSWRHLYPWICVAGVLGPFGFSIDVTRPDAAALQYQQDREEVRVNQ